MMDPFLLHIIIFKSSTHLIDDEIVSLVREFYLSDIVLRASPRLNDTILVNKIPTRK